MRQDLIERARQGDREAFGQLAALEIDRLHAIARLIVRDPYLAEDAVQEALIRCWRQLPKLRDIATRFPRPPQLRHRRQRVPPARSLI